VFTTHTPVPAGHDQFPLEMVRQVLGEDCAAALQSLNACLDGYLNMTYLALAGSRYVNGVAMQHGEVSRHMFPSYSVRAITNGVHGLTWTAPPFRDLYDRYMPEWRRDNLYLRYAIGIPLEEIRAAHGEAKRALLDEVRKRTGVQLDDKVMTIGFARRAATYKRADLIFENLERLKKIVNDPWKPVQIIFAGKAHPADDEGKRIIQKVYQYAHQQDFGGRIAFVEDYGEQMAQYLVHGVDVWLNNPVPPMEACGTSGMKASLNGVLHLSIPDGWWIEGYNGKNGWSFGESAVLENRNKADSDQIYELLEREIVPLYYSLSDDQIPHMWVKRMKEAMKSNSPAFSARRMVKEYVQRAYVPALDVVAKTKGKTTPL
jgi:starch phosphorylase